MDFCYWTCKIVDLFAKMVDRTFSEIVDLFSKPEDGSSDPQTPTPGLPNLSYSFFKKLILRDIVNDNGGHFIPLVCETFGVWSPYALSVLGSIADRTTVRNGLPQKFARRQLLQQLSVTLCRYNAKMILRQYSLTAEDKFPDFDIG